MRLVLRYAAPSNLPTHVDGVFRAKLGFAPPDTEETTGNCIRQTSAGGYLPLDPRVTQQLVGAIKKTVGDVGKNRRRTAFIVAMDIRRYGRRFIESNLYELSTRIIRRSCLYVTVSRSTNSSVRTAVS